MTPANPAAVLFDMDGTLVDSEPYWMRAEIELVTSFGGRWTHEDGLTLVGLGLWESAKAFQAAGVPLEADTIVHRLTARVRAQLNEDGVPWRPGARELLAQVRKAGVPAALVTMSIRGMAEQVVAAIPFDAFDTLVTGDEVARPKPYPDAYLEAAARLGVPIERCVAIEDSVGGVTAALAAGAATIGVPHLVALPQAPTHDIWPTLSGRTLQDLAEVLASRVRA